MKFLVVVKSQSVLEVVESGFSDDSATSLCLRDLVTPKLSFLTVYCMLYEKKHANLDLLENLFLLGNTQQCRNFTSIRHIYLILKYLKFF